MNADFTAIQIGEPIPLSAPKPHPPKYGTQGKRAPPPAPAPCESTNCPSRQHCKTTGQSCQQFNHWADTGTIKAKHSRIPPTMNNRPRRSPPRELERAGIQGSLDGPLIDQWVAEGEHEAGLHRPETISFGNHTTTKGRNRIGTHAKKAMG